MRYLKKIKCDNEFFDFTNTFKGRLLIDVSQLEFYLKVMALASGSSVK